MKKVILILSLLVLVALSFAAYFLLREVEGLREQYRAERAKGLDEVASIREEVASIREEVASIREEVDAARVAAVREAGSIAANSLKETSASFEDRLEALVAHVGSDPLGSSQSIEDKILMLRNKVDLADQRLLITGGELTSRILDIEDHVGRRPLLNPASIEDRIGQLKSQVEAARVTGEVWSELQRLDFRLTNIEIRLRL